MFALFQCISAILEKFKEKKLNVVTALREAIDAIYPSVRSNNTIDLHAGVLFLTLFSTS